MTDAHDTPTLDDVMETVEKVTPDRHEHAKASPHLDEDELEERSARPSDSKSSRRSGSGSLLVR